MKNTSDPRWRIVYAVAGAGLAIFWLGGWYIAWPENLPTTDPIYIHHGVAVAFNGAYYGLIFSTRFFNSPVVAWALGLAGGFVIVLSVRLGLELAQLEIDAEQAEQGKK